MRRMTDPRGGITSLSFSRDSQLLATTCERRMDVHIWDVVAGEVVQILKWSSLSFRDACLADMVAFAPGGDFVAVAGVVGVGVWSTTTWRPVARSPDNFETDDVTELAWDPGLVPALAVTDSEGTSVWSLPHPLNGQPLSEIASWYEWGGRRTAFSGDGFFLASHGDGGLSVWNAYAGVGVQSVVLGTSRPGRPAGPVRFSPVSATLAYASGDRIFSRPQTLDDPNAVIRYVGHTDRVHALRYTPDGRTLISASADGTVRLWEASTGLEKRCFDMRVGKIAAADVSPDGAVAAVGGANGEIVVWDLE